MLQIRTEAAPPTPTLTDGLASGQSRALDRGTHLVRGVLGVGLALGSAPGHGAGADVAEVDLPLGGRPAAGLTPHNDGAARQDLLGETPHTISGHSLVH